MSNEPRLGTWVAAAAAAAAVALAAYAWWRQQGGSATQSAASAAGASAASAAGAAPAAPASVALLPPAEVVALPPAVPGPAPAEPDLRSRLVDLLGAAAVHSFVQTHDFASRLVVTVDGLGREHAAPLRWPVSPIAGRFTTTGTAGSETIAAENALRYRPFVEMVERADVARSVALYLRLRPALQQAYEDLGYPGRRFDARLLEVIDLLLATPPAPPPVKVQLTEVKGPIPSTRPWVRYEYADPDLEALSAGQKILLRIGEDNAARLKARLRALRAELRRQGVTG